MLASPYLNPVSRMSLFSVSKVEIEPEGGKVIDSKLKGCYWVVMLSVDEIDALEGRVEVIKEGQTGEFNGKTVENRKSLEIGINPEQAFFYRGVRQETTTITEDAYKSVHNKVTGQVWFDKSYHVAPLMSSHYVWDQSFWMAETTFKVQVWLNDVLITPYGGKVMDTHAIEVAFTIDTRSGQIAFRSLGGQTGGLGDARRRPPAHLERELRLRLGPSLPCYCLRLGRLACKLNKIYGEFPVTSPTRFLQTALRCSHPDLSEQEIDEVIERTRPSEPDWFNRVYGFSCPCCGTWKPPSSMKRLVKEPEKRDPKLATLVKKRLEKQGWM